MSSLFVVISSAKKYAYCEAAHLASCRILKIDLETCKNLVSNLGPHSPRTRISEQFKISGASDICIQLQEARTELERRNSEKEHRDDKAGRPHQC
jgi:hypothetical protein